MDGALAAVTFAAHELALFAAVGFALFGIDDLLVDAIWIARALWRRATVYSRYRRADAGSLAPPARAGPLAVFLPAWDESDVIGAMLGHTLGRWGQGDYRIFVGCYRNDQATQTAVRRIAAADPRVRAVIAPRPGPTTKADCLNALYRAMQADERDRVMRYKAVVLHDAEDVVHSDELRVFQAMIERAALVQLPVLPLIDPGSRWVSGHYADEFAESHGKELVVREAIGAGVPSAGVACAVERGALEALAGGGEPFNPDSLTEDYEIGLRLAELGYRSMFVRLPAAAGRPVVMTREHFPADLDAAVRQKARWMTGIALSGWDRMGWRGGLAERWMRLRDRRSVLAAVILCAGYAAVLAFGLLSAAGWPTGWAAGLDQPASTPLLELLLRINLGLLAWRLAMRASFVTASYGPAEGLRSIPRAFVANIVAMMAARQALTGYFLARRTGETRWDKTRHVFPDAVPAE